MCTEAYNREPVVIVSIVLSLSLVNYGRSVITCYLYCKNVLIFFDLCKSRTNIICFICHFPGNLTKHMKSKAHGKKCQAMGVSESSVDEPESEETGSLTYFPSTEEK